MQVNDNGWLTSKETLFFLSYQRVYIMLSHVLLSVEND
jgi:hypothetical protein